MRRYRDNIKIDFREMGRDFIELLSIKKYKNTKMKSTSSGL